MRKEKINMFIRNSIRRELIGSLFVFAVLTSVYFYTIAPTVSLWDCGEFIACSHILGVAHPPGTPFYILIGRIFDIIFPFKEVAKRINFFSVLSSAVAGGFLYLIIIKIFKRFERNKVRELPISCHLIAIFSSIGAGFCFSVWDSAVEAEVYAASLLITTIGLWLVLHWDENGSKEGKNNLLLLLVYLLSLSFGVHLLSLLLIPGTLVFIILSNWKVFKNPKLISAAFILVLIGISTYIYLLIRAHANPAINESDPTTWTELFEVIRRKQYGSDNFLVRHTSWETNYGFIRALMEQFKVFFKYFSWQFFPYPRESTGVLLRNISIIGTWVYVLIGLWGMFIHFKKDKKSFYLIFILFILLSVGLVFYLNHEFSPSDPNPAHQPREPRERDYFWSSAFFFFMFYIAVAIYWVYERLKKGKVISYCVLGLSFVIGIIPLVSNIKSHANRRENWIAHEYAYNLLVCPRENSILFTNGDNDTFPLWFLQEVKGFRKFDSKNKKGVRVACLALMNTDWYIRQMKAAGVPMDFVSPFKGSSVERAYIQKKREGETNLEFEDWVIENLYFLKTADRKTILRKDIAIRNIILSSQGIKPTYEALTLPADSFVAKYIREDFNPSINIYYSASVSPGNMYWLQNHLLLESLLFRLVGKKGKEMIDITCFLDLFKNKLDFSSVGNIKVYKSPAAQTIMQNYVSICYKFGSSLRRKVISSNVLLNSEKHKMNLSKEDEDKLKESALLLEKGLNLAEDYSMLATVFSELRGIYVVLGKPDSLLIFVEKLKNKKNLSMLNFFEGRLLLDKLIISKNISEKEKILIEQEVENKFKQILKFSQEESVNGYIGLLDLYNEMGNNYKRDSLVEKLREQPKMFSYAFMYNYDFVKDTAMSIYLLKKWLEVNPYDKQAKNLLDSLRINSHN